MLVQAESNPEKNEEGSLQLISDAVCKAAAELASSINALNCNEIEARLERALNVLRSDVCSKYSDASDENRLTLEIAQTLLSSYKFNKAVGTATFTIPAGVSDPQAMNALNELFIKNYPELNRGAIDPGAQKILEELPNSFPNYCQHRDISKKREVIVRVIAPETLGNSRDTQGANIKENGEQFSDPRDQAIAAGIHACQEKGANLFGIIVVRGCVPGFAVWASSTYGIKVFRNLLNTGRSDIAASSSPRS